MYGQDYQTTDPSGKKSGTLTFAPGTSDVHVKVQGINDGVYGLDKQFTLTLSNPKGASFVAGATIAETGTITESTAAPIIGLQGCGTVTGGGDATFALTTSYASPVPATVDWATSDVSTTSRRLRRRHRHGDRARGLARRDDHDPHACKPALRRSRLQGDDLERPAHDDPGQRVRPRTAPCTSRRTSARTGCRRCRSPTPLRSRSRRQALRRCRRRSRSTLSAPASQPPTPQPVNVHWQTQAGTATAPADFTSASGDLHWDAGTFGNQSFTVQINPFDGNATGPQKFTVQFTTTSAAFVGANLANVTVVPPTSPPVISVADASALESAGSIPAVVSSRPRRPVR